MDIADGNLSFSATIDTSSLERSRETLIQFFMSMGLSAQEAGKRADEAMKQIESSVSEAMSSVKSDAEALEVLEAALQEIQDQAEEMDDESLKEFFNGVAESMGKTLDEMKEMQSMDYPFEDYDEKTVSARTAMRDMREELIQMKLRGEEGTEAYNELLTKMGDLQDAMSDTQQATRGMASDTANLDAVLGAAQLTAGGFSAVMGALNLVGADEETKALAQAQKKLQAVIAITTGLQSIQNALQKQSALMLGMQRLKTLALAKAEDVKTAATMKGVAATKAATAAQNSLNKSVLANPYSILAAAIITAIAALTKWLMYDRKVEEQSKQTSIALHNEVSLMERLAQLQSDALDKVSDKYDKLDEKLEYHALSFEQYSEGVKLTIAEENAAYQELLKANGTLFSTQGASTFGSFAMLESELRTLDNRINDRKVELDKLKTRVDQGTADDYTRQRINDLDDMLHKDEEKLKKLKPLYDQGIALRESHNAKLLDLAKKEYKIEQQEVEDSRAATNAKIEQMKDGYAKQAEVIKSGYAAQREAMEAQLKNPESNLTDKEKEAIRQRIKETEDKEQKELNELYRRRNESIRKAEEELMKSEYEAVAKRNEMLLKQSQVAVDLMAEGSQKELAQMQLDHEKRMAEIEKAARQEEEALQEANKRKWLNEQVAKGLSVTDADWYASAVYKSLTGGLTEEQRRQVEEQRAQDAENEFALARKRYDDYLQKLLLDYGNYTAQKQQMDDQYLQDLSAATLALLTATTEKEKKIYADLIKDMGKIKARKDLELNLDLVDASVYATVEDKMEAINKAYDTYVESLVKAGASEAEIAAVERKRVAVAGKLAKLQAQEADLRDKIAVVVQQMADIEDEAEKKKLSEEMAQWQKLLNEIVHQIKQLDSEIDNATKTTKTFAQTWQEAADNIKNASMAEQGQAISSFMDKWAELEGTSGFSKLGNVIQSLASADFAGLFSSIVDIFTSLALSERNEYIENVLRTIEAESRLLETHYNLLLSGEKSIFGEDVISGIEEYVKVLDEVKKSEADYAILQAGLTRDRVEQLSEYWRDRNGYSASELLNGGLKNVERITFKTKHNFLGIGDEWKSLVELAKEYGYDLYDEYGNLNAEFAQYLLDNMEYLYESDRKMLEKAVVDGNAYKEAMEDIASYLNNLFGSVADTIADKFLDSFLKGEQAAVDFGAVVSDVAKGMAKDFIKNMLMENVFSKYEEQFKSIIMSDMTMEDKQRLMLSYFSAMQADAQALQPAIQSYLEGMSQFFEAAEDSSIGAGTALTSASQESIDLLNGQLNAMRTVQLRIDTTIGNILTQLMGLRSDVTSFHGDSNNKLDQIIDNTSGSEGSGIVRALGMYFG